MRLFVVVNVPIPPLPGSTIAVADVPVPIVTDAWLRPEPANVPLLSTTGLAKAPLVGLLLKRNAPFLMVVVPQ